MDARVAAMDDDGIAMQAISVMPELFSYWAEPALGRSFCRSLNEAIATMVAGAPDRFVLRLRRSATPAEATTVSPRPGAL